MIKAVLLTVAAILAVFWIIGLAAHILGAAIHIFIVAAIVVALGSFLVGRETA